MEHTTKIIDGLNDGPMFHMMDYSGDGCVVPKGAGAEAMISSAMMDTGHVRPGVAETHLVWFVDPLRRTDVRCRRPDAALSR